VLGLWLGPHRTGGGAISRELIQAAFSYVWADWPVIPVRRNVANLLPSWTPFKTRLPTDREIESWPWDRADGLALVVSDKLYERLPNVWVVDIEHEHRAAGERWLDQHCRGWRDSLVVASGGGGLHIYGQASGRPRTTRFAYGDVKAYNSLVYLPPTWHARTGNRYRWLSQGTPLPLSPERLPGVMSRPQATAREAGWAAAAFRTRLGTGEGRRVLLSRLVGYLRGHRIDVATAVAILQLWDAQNPDPLGPDEVRRHVEGMYARYGVHEMSDRPAHTHRVRVG
jgi:Bifunctional DNA primase/polymerase, N-terminal